MKAFRKEKKPSLLRKGEQLLYFSLLLWCCLAISPFSRYSSNSTNGASGGSFHTWVLQFPACPSCCFLLPGVIREPYLPPSARPQSTCLAKGLHSAEASFLCSWHKQLFLLSLLLMLPGELADHFLLADITPPRNDRLPPSVSLIIKRHFLSSPIMAVVRAGVGMLPCQGQQGRLDHWIPEEWREGVATPVETGDPSAPVVPGTFSPVTHSVWLLCFLAPC